MAKRRRGGATPGVLEALLKPERVPLDLLVPDPRNARLHDRRNLDAIKASLVEFGQDEPLVVQRPGNVVRKGNGRLAAMRELGWPDAAVVFVDEDDLRAAARAVAGNRTAELASWDPDVLAELVVGLPDDLKLATGFDLDALEALATAPAGDAGAPPDPAALWGGMPACDQADLAPFRTIHVHFARQEDVDAFAALVGQPITDRTRFLWHPRAEIGRTRDKRWVEAEPKA